MTIDTNYEELVAILNSEQEVIVTKSLQTLVKNIPDLDRKGDFDPRVLKNVKKQFGNKVKVENREAPSQIETNDIPIETIRANMGWPNKDMTKTEINVTYRTMEVNNSKIRIRIYSPKHESNLPAILYFHGGGFIGGSLDTVENPCKALSEKANAIVISVDYRLAPEYPFPHALNDCYETVKWVYHHANEMNIAREKISVSGDSAGGNLANGCSMLDRNEQSNMIKFQALVYPVVLIGNHESFKWKINEYSVHHYHELVKKAIYALGSGKDLIERLYLQGKQENTDPYVSPLLATDCRGLPESLIITAEFDYLRLEGKAYAEKLASFDVNTKYIQYQGMDHAFIDKFGIYPQAEDCIDEIAKSIHSIFHS
ncbi:alpha/beta hydrolase [Bacillus sp. AK128]